MANVTKMPPIEPADADDSASEMAPLTTAAPELAKKKTGRPRKGEEPDPETRARQFFDRAAQIPREDWGNRAWMYLYIDEPICDDKQWGKMKYAKKLHQPIFDLEKVKDWYGSCKGWISLNLRKQDAQNTDQIGRHEFEIFDIHCPPKIPKACWTDDPVNKKWAALLPPEPKAPSEGAASLVDSIKIYKEIRDEVREEREDPEPQFDQTRSTLETMKLAKELFAAPVSTATTDKPADPFDTAAKIMAMRANDPMMAVMMELLKNANAANEAARQREYELLQKQATAAATPPKTFLDQLLELAALGDKLDPLKKLFGFGNGASEVGRAARTTGLDVVRDLVTGPAGEKLAQGIGVLISNLASATTPNPAGPPKPAPVVLSGANPDGTAPQENPEQRIQRIGETITRAMLFEFFLKDEESGEAFAQWMFDGAPKDYIFIRSYGAEELIRRYRRVPEAWPVIQAKETEFLKFLQDFCAWNPNEDEGAAPPGNGDDGVSSGIKDLDPDNEARA